MLFVGRLSNEKNLDTLLAAWRLVHASCPEAQLLVVGDGPRARDVTGPGIVRAGSLYGTELAAVFASADVFAFPSETETFGNVVVEAAASGLPAVVAAAGAAHEHVAHGATGLVVPGADPAAFAGALVELLDDADARARMGHAARERAVGYDFARAVRATWQVYESAFAPKAALQVAS